VIEKPMGVKYFFSHGPDGTGPWLFVY